MPQSGGISHDVIFYGYAVLQACYKLKSLQVEICQSSISEKIAENPQRMFSKLVLSPFLSEARLFSKCGLCNFFNLILP